ncbi:hypothetical protein [Sphingomonas morindae]|uniref:Uncharacterized protein n=1 Tax=Sphingomonas morindae TaxID=1541170 RepID=A0ABY4X6U2_9SPHN|nr:hypothetical protein [Sphingomonas morindae]USI72633.1 hypothetical protein LHA26_15325 [Sphingomonas morindae]
MATSVSGAGLGYSDLVDLALAAEVVAKVTITDAVRLKDADAAGVPPDLMRLYVEGDVTALISGRGGLPAHVSWLAEVKPAQPNHVPKLRKAEFLLFARRVPNRPNMLQLVARGAMLPWSPAIDQRSRAILTDTLARSAPPAITGVGHAFHVPGSIPGEGETQIFLKTADSRPVSLSILRRPGEEPRWSVALGELVDDAAQAPQRDTFLWYRLACGLPETLPDDSVADQSPDDAAAARADYQLVRQKLGGCGRLVTPG